MGRNPEHDMVRRSYDAVAGEYAAHFRDELASKPLDRALLAALVEQTEPGQPIADLGCGPGHVSGWLADRGAPTVGIDLSPEMISLGRRDYPAVEFREGDLLDLPAGDGEFAAAVALYSIIHLQPSELQIAFDEMRRVLRISGLLLVAFHAGAEERHRDEWWGHQVDLTFRFLEPDRIIGLLDKAGFVVEARMEREHYADEVQTRRAYLRARRTS